MKTFLIGLFCLPVFFFLSGVFAWPVWAVSPVSQVYVDDDYKSDATNDGHTWGVDAFSTIQDGVDAVTADGTINVKAGVYTGATLISKKVTIAGSGSNTIINTGYFFDDFNDGNANGWWLGYSLSHPSNNGNWRVENGTLVQDTGYDGVTALVDDSTGSDQTIQTKLKINGPSGSGGLIFWYKDDNNWTVATVVPANQWIEVSSLVDGVTHGYQYSYPSLANDTWYDFKVIADGETGNLDIYLDGTYLFSHTAETPNRTGKTGVFHGNAGGYFDDFRLSPFANTNAGTGISLSSGSDGSTVKDLKVIGNGDGIGIDSTSGIILQNIIADNNKFNPTSGILALDVDGLNISGSTFSNNIVGIDLKGTTTGVNITTSTFTSNSTYHISNDTPNEVTASDGNSWGAFNANDINTLLYDTKDSEILGRVVFDATAPSVDAGIDKSANASFTQNATVSDTFGVSTYLWSQDSGPGTVTFDDTAIEDPQISADSEGTYVIRLTATDTSGNTADDTFQLTWDTTPPQLDSAWTQDSDHDGHIDTIKMTFNENIKDSLLAESGSDGWSVDGYTVNSVTSGSGANDSILYLNLTEKSSFDTNAIPDVTYTPTQNPNSTHDLAENELQEITKTSEDRAEPAVIGAKTQDSNTNGQLDAIKIQFSESVDDSLLINETDHWTVAGYTISSVDTGATANDDILVLKLTEKTTNDTGAKPDISYARTNNENSVHDLAVASNELVNDTWSTTDLSAPVASWTSPAAGSTISGTGTLTVSATDEDITKIKSVKFQYKRNDGVDTYHTLVTDTSVPYSYAWDTTSLALGEYNVRAVATDNAENSTTIDRIVYVAAVVTSQSSFTVGVESISVSWTTDRPTDGRIIYDKVSHGTVDAAASPNYGYSSSTGTIDTAYSTSHTLVFGGLSAETIYYWRVVSAGTPVVIGVEGQNKTMSQVRAGNGGGGGGGGGGVTPVVTPTVNVVANPPAPAAVQGQVAGAETEEEVVPPSPTPESSPTPEVKGVSTPNFNWWLVIAPSLLLLLLLGLIFWPKRG